MVILFFFLPHFPSSPFTSFCMGSSLTSAVFIPPLYFWHWYLPPHYLFRPGTGPEHYVPTSFNKMSLNTFNTAPSPDFPGFSNPFKHSDKVKHNSCKQLLFKEEELCWCITVKTITIFLQGLPSKGIVSNGQTWDKLGWVHELYPERKRETNNWHE